MKIVYTTEMTYCPMKTMYAIISGWDIFFLNTVIGPYKSAPNQINHAKQSRENHISILLISSVDCSLQRKTESEC